jgi:hypothetical protein
MLLSKFKVTQAVNIIIFFKKNVNKLLLKQLNQTVSRYVLKD